MKEKKVFNIYILQFFLVVLLSFFPLWLSGKTIVHRIDAIGQYYPAFLYIGQWLRNLTANILSGNFSVPVYDFSIGLGEDIISSLNYYGFGDPLNLLAIFSNTNNGPYLYTFMFFFRLFLAGLTFQKYCSYAGVRNNLSVIGAFVYVFSGYAVVSGTLYMEFLNPLIYFPLMVLGVEKILHGEKGMELLTAVWFAGLNGFYFLYITSLGLAFYCLMRILFLKVRQPLKIILTSLGYYLLGCMLSAPILLPAIGGYLNSARSSVNILEILTNVDNWIFKPGRLFMFAKGFLPFTAPVTNYWMSVPILVLLMPLISLYYSHQHGWKKYKEIVFVSLFSIVAWCIPVFSYVASAFGQYYTRWIFMVTFGYSFGLIYIASNELEIRRQKQLHRIVLANIILCLFTMLGFPYYFGDVLLTPSEVESRTDSPINYIKTDINDNSRVVTDVLTVNGRPDNLAMINDSLGSSYWLSIIDQNVQNYNDLDGKNILGYRSYDMNDSIVYESLAGVKYKLTKVPSKNYRILESFEYEKNEWYLQENEINNSMGAFYVKSLDVSVFNELNLIERMDVASRYAVMPEANNLTFDSNAELIDYEIHKTDEEYQIKFESSDDLYLLINSAEIQGLQSYRIGDDLYKIENGEAISQKLSSEITEVSFAAEREIGDFKNTVLIVKLENDKVLENLNKLFSNAVINCRLDTNSLYVETESDSEGVLCIAVPFNNSWDIFVDGNKTESFEVLNSFTGIRLDKGFHSIVMKYTNFAVLYGFAIAILGLMIVLHVLKKK